MKAGLLQMNELIRGQLRRIPAVHRVIDSPIFVELLETHEWSRNMLVQAVGQSLNEIRQRIMDGIDSFASEDEIIEAVFKQVIQWTRPHLLPVINATGVILHTNLGRARLAREAIEQMVQIGQNYSNLEYDMAYGVRGSRHAHVEKWICKITGAEAAMVVNNNAAAVFLVLRELAHNKEVIVSRGELVEIGGSFRVSEIMAESGARLVEVGTTNKTKRKDYERHITEQTALLMKVHRSNFRMIGFTEEVSRAELVELGNQFGIPVYEDLGSGVLYDLRLHNIGDEPTVNEVLQQGVDLVSFSGDKLLGGPQAGIIAGKKQWIDRLKQNQLMRMIRVDKMTLAALEATLRLYLNQEQAIRKIPVLRDMLQDVEEIRARAMRFFAWIHEYNVLSDWTIEVEQDSTEVGGGSLPAVTLPTYVVSITHSEKSVHHLERLLRASNPAVIGRISKNRLLLDFRTICDDEVPLLMSVFKQIQYSV